MFEFFDRQRQNGQKNQLVALVLQKGLAKKIEGLQFHYNDLVYMKSIQLLETYFELVE